VTAKRHGLPQIRETYGQQRHLKALRESDDFKKLLMDMQQNK
jgi:hypothetical protein